MTERIDHAAEADAYLVAARMERRTGNAEHAASLVATAQVHATLAVVEQLRIVNIIALNDRFAGEVGDALMSAKRENGYIVARELNPEIARALGIETKETNE